MKSKVTNIQLIISIHAPRVGGDSDCETRGDSKRGISIHAPRVGGDSKSAQISLSLLFKAENISRFVLLQGYYTGYDI